MIIASEIQTPGGEEGKEKIIQWHLFNASTSNTTHEI